jgi:hypothetical protein
MVVSFITLKPYEEIPHWSTSHLQKQRQHSTTCKKSSCSTTRTDMGLIEDLWFNALNNLEDIDIPANTTTFTDYLTTQWIDGDRKVWNHFNTDGPRTTNHIEGWHNKLKKKVSHAHPNIYTLINTFKDIHAANSCSIYDILCLMLIVKLISMYFC